MRVITNISSITDNSGTAPVITYSNQVQTFVQTPTPPPPRPRNISGIIIIDNGCGCGFNNGCGCACNNCCHCNCCNSCNNCCNTPCHCHCNNACNCQCNDQNDDIVYHYYCN